MRRRLIGVAPVLILALGSSGCGVLLQTAFGWTNEDRVVEGRTHTVKITTEPAGAEVTRTGRDGTTSLGASPLTDEIPYEHQTITETPAVVGLLIGGVLEVVGAIAAFASAGEDDFDIIAIGGTLAYLGGQDLIIALFYGLSGAQIRSNRAVDGPMLTYVASADGKSKEYRVKVPDSSFAKIVLNGSPEKPVVTRAPPAAPPPTPEVAPATGGRKKWVIAVMNVEDVNAKSKKRAVDKDLVRDLGDQLRIFIAQTGMRTIDRSAQDRVLREQIAEAKSSSYKACYDDSCQIELGKALAASHILRSRITRFGSKCVLNAELIDLRAEVTVKAASARGDCRAEGFLTMSEEVAENIVN